MNSILFAAGSTVTLTDRRDELNRFRLTGPLSARVLCEALTQDESGLDLPSSLSLKAEYFNRFWKALRLNSLSAFSYLRVSYSRSVYISSFPMNVHWYLIVCSG